MTTAAAGPTRRQTGQLGEEFAAQYLSRTLGWTMIARNWRCRYGELDIVAQDASWLVVVEVRSRSGTNFGSGAESVVGAKLSQLWRLVPALLEDLGRKPDSVVRLDVISVTVRAQRVIGFEHLRRIGA